MVSSWVKMIVVILPFCRGLEEGDVAVPRSSSGETVRESFIMDPSQLWPDGKVPYLFETLPLEDGGEEPLFHEDHKQMMREAMSHINKMVPCIQFRLGTDFRLSFRLIT